MSNKIVGEDGRVYVAKKPFYKRWWFIALVILLLIGGCSALLTPGEDADLATTETGSVDDATVQESEEVVETEAPAEADVPREYQNALRKAEAYADRMAMSKAGIYEQLVSEYGEGFSPEAAQYAIDTIQWDWNANALKKAESYQDSMAMSPSAIYDQLVSEHGEQFTPEEAQYAIDNLSQ